MLIDNLTLRWVACVGLLSVALVAPSTALAQEPSAETQAEAKAHLQQGAKAYSKKRYKDAVDHFLNANRLVPSPALSFNIAKAYEKLGDFAATLNFYRDYLRRAPNAPDRPDIEKLVAKYEGMLRERGVQQLSVLSTPEGATVALDGEAVGVTPWTGELPPGKHIATVQLRGYADAVEQFELAPDHAMDVSVELEAAAESAAALPQRQSDAPQPTSSEPPPVEDATRDEPRADRGVRAPTWIAFGVGGVALGAALGFELMRRSSEEDARNAPTQVEAKDSFDTMEKQQTTSRILAGVGGVALLTGGVLLIIDMSRSSDKAASRPAFIAGCTPSSCALALRGTM
jgi:tetratricopeptide (TPR) repeat protein